MPIHYFRRHPGETAKFRFLLQLSRLIHSNSEMILQGENSRLGGGKILEPKTTSRSNVNCKQICCLKESNFHCSRVRSVITDRDLPKEPSPRSSPCPNLKHSLSIIKKRTIRMLPAVPNSSPRIHLDERKKLYLMKPLSF